MARLFYHQVGLPVPRVNILRRAQSPRAQSPRAPLCFPLAPLSLSSTCMLVRPCAQPSYAILDECTSAVSDEITDKLYETCHSLGITRGRRDCHIADDLSPSLLKHLPKVEGGAAE